MSVGNRLRVQASLRLYCAGKAFGPGIAQLLEGVERLGSLRRSAFEMNMSYSKAWTILRSCEGELGFPLLERRTGGSGGGGAVLTGRGREFLTRYRAFQAEADTLLKQALDRHFSDFPV